MTDNQKFSAILLEIGEMLQKKNSYIDMKEFECERLRQLLNIAEDKIQELQKGKENEQ